MGKPLRILIMAGGTGGHIFPALAIAEAMRADGADIHWLGTANGLESRLVPKANIPLHYLVVKGLRGKGIVHKCLVACGLLKAIFQALKIIWQLKPDVVLGMGGYASGPGGIAAWLMRKPIVIHEQNAAPGMTNRWLGRIARRVLQAFPHSFTASYHAKTVGNPVRAQILQLPAPAQRFAERSGPIRLLILGGSQGAMTINAAIPAAIAALPAEIECDIWHQTGANHLAATQDKYAEMAVKARLEPFIEDMAVAYSWADLVICRAGALTISELSAAGVGSILIPFPHAVDDHQTKNALYLVAIDAAELLTDKQLVSGELHVILAGLIKERAQLQIMAEAARTIAPINAVAEIAGEIDGVVNPKK